MKNQVTVVPSDQLIMVEGEPLFFPYQPLFPMRALQWREGCGHVEIDGQPNRSLGLRDYPLEVLPYVALFEAEKKRLAEVQEGPEEPVPLSFEEARAAKLREILEGANQAYHQVTACYSIPEERSWEQQKAEAEALLADENAPAPIVRPLAENRNIPVLMFARRILDNAARAEALSLTIIMRQQSYEDALAAAENIEAVRNIRAEYPAPDENGA